MVWTAERTSTLRGATASLMSILLIARFEAPALNKQLVERTPLVTEEKAKLVRLKTQCMVPGRGRLACPSS